MEINNKWELNIEKAGNGYIIKGRNENDFPITEVIERPENEEGELQATQKLLWFITEYFGIFYSKRNKKNLTIDIVENKEEE